MLDFKLDRLQEAVVKCVSEKRYDEAMTLVKSFVEKVINDPESVGVVLTSRELDILCETLADAYYGYRRHAPKAERRGTIIVASELVNAGGHVELIKDYVALGLFESPVRVVLSDVFNRIERDEVGEWEASLGCEVFIAEPRTLSGKLDVLVERIEEWNPSTILTVGHNQDVVCIVAAHAPGPTNRFYIHHGDHHLSLGVTCHAFQHVDLHNMTYELCKNEVGVACQYYWPLSAVRPSREKTSFLDRGALTTCACGRMSKFESGSYAFSYERAVALMLKVTRGYHVHIGELTEEFIQKIHSELDVEGVSRDRFIHIEWVASLSRALVEELVDVYIASFPIGGGKAVVEAMSVGIPVVTHESYRSRYLGCVNLAYPESFVWNTYEQLIDIFECWDVKALRKHGQFALRHFERYYSKDAFVKAFANDPACAADVPPLRAYHGNRLMNYLDSRRVREQRYGWLESDRSRLLGEWSKLHAAYDEHCATILGLQLKIERLSDENNTLAMKLLEQQARDEKIARSWKTKVKNLLYTIHVNKRS